ncbi:MAG: shikimate dehydrogenase [Muribaculaceae bacterium]|nr:shikimate dehydrogenase [Muribaculaceae bacterium]
MHFDNEKIYGLIGFPLGHSFSQDYFNRKFDAENISARYLNFEIPDIGDFMEIVSQYPMLSGLNVTIPYKQQVIPYLTAIDPVAEQIGAVNVIKIERTKGGNPTFVGYNSDVVGFSDSIAPMLNEKRCRALILGTGGAAKAVEYALQNLGVATTFVSRTKREGMLTYEELTPEVMAQNLVIVNTTPLGMYPHTEECPDIPYDCITPEHLCYDLLYNPDVTLFMRKAQERGAEVKNGLEMLLLQAFEAWLIWNR